MATLSALDNTTDLGLEAFLGAYSQQSDADNVRQLQLNTVNDKVTEIITQVNTNTTVCEGVDDSYATTISEVKVAEASLTATEIVGTSAGDLGHADGAEIVAAPGTGYVLQFISAVLIYDYDTAAYTGGGDDLVVQVGSTGAQVTHSAAIAAADLLGASGDKIAYVTALSASDQALSDNPNISLHSTAFTQPGTAAGVLRVKVAYRVITTGL